jgi:hypothetical protein
MTLNSKLSRVAGIGIVLAALCLASAAQAAPRMYTGSLIIPAFANDTTTGSSSPYSTNRVVGIPLTGNCNTQPFHAKEVFTFELPKDTPTYTVTFTIPDYGGQVATIDTNGDTLPDVASGCGTLTQSQGDPLTGGGGTQPAPVNTTGATNTSRATNDPRGFTLPEWALRKTKTGASFGQYNLYLWEVHFADLHNEAAAFAKGGGDGSFTILHNAAPTKRSVVQKAGKNEFGGVMRLLGIYGDFEGYLYNDVTTSVFTFDWLFDYLGNGGQGTKAGAVTAAYVAQLVQYGHTKASGYPTTSTVDMSVFKWTTGAVTVTAVAGSFPTIIRRNGYDNRTPMGSGVVQMVSPMITKWTGAGTSSTAGVGIMKVVFAPEPSEWMLLASGVSMLGLVAHRRRKS